MKPFFIKIQNFHTRTTDTQSLNPQFFATQIQIQIPLKNSWDVDIKRLVYL